MSVIAPLTSNPNPTPPSARRVHYLPTLDGWRAIAILLVLAHHGAHSIRDALPAFAPLTRIFINYGRFGVYIFFGLSGFLICTRLLRELSDHNRISLKAFYIRRIHRIVPPMLVFLAAVAILGLSGILTVNLHQWLACLFLYANDHPTGTWTLNHFWTLAMEEHFYLFWPAILALAAPRRALGITVAVAIVVAVWRYIDLTYRPIPALPFALERTDTACDALLWGAIFALLFAAPRSRDFLRPALRPSLYWLVLCALIASLVIPTKTRPTFLAFLSLQIILVPALLIGTLSHPRSVLSRFLESSPLRWIGRLSYSLYLWQQVFLVWNYARSPLMGPVQYFPLNFVATFAIAIASYYLIEKPFIREGYRRAARYAQP